MQQREKAGGPMRHPTIRAFQCLELGPGDDPFAAAAGSLADCIASSSSSGGGCSGSGAPPFELGLPFWADTATGQLWTEKPPQQLVDSRGGLFADEPGLGKTITMVRFSCATSAKDLLACREQSRWMDNTAA